MTAFWAFVSDPANQKTLGFFGGGIVVVVGGLWTFIKFFAARKTDDGRASAKTTVTGDQNVVGGRDATATFHSSPPGKAER